MSNLYFLFLISQRLHLTSLGNFVLQLNFPIYFLIRFINQLPSYVQYINALTLRFDMARQKVFVRRRRQRKRMEFLRFEGGASKAHPLSGKVLQVRWPVKFDLDDVRR